MGYLCLNLYVSDYLGATKLILSAGQEYSDVPSTLPDWLVPSSKAHLVQATRALSAPVPEFSPPSPPSDSDTPGLKDGFDWYMSPSDKNKYTEIYTANKSPHGSISFDSLSPLYSSLDVPDTDIRSAWNLVNPSADRAIGKDAALAFLHILNNRHEGYRIPRSIPPSLRASFQSNKIDYSSSSSSGPSSAAAQKWGANGEQETSTGRKAKFGDTYLSRLGVGGKSSYASHAGTDFSSAKGPGGDEWEEVRLKRELGELEGKIEKVERLAEEASKRKGGAGRRGGEVKRELELLLEWKRRELRGLRDGDVGGSGGGGGLKGVEGEIGAVREQIEGLETHLRGREGVLDGLRREIESCRAGGT